jgi:hypothetical protein
MPVRLPAAEAEDVQGLRRNHAAHRLADAMDDLLKAHVLPTREITRDLLTVVLRRDQTYPYSAGYLLKNAMASSSS